MKKLLSCILLFFLSSQIVIAQDFAIDTVAVVQDSTEDVGKLELEEEYENNTNNKGVIQLTSVDSLSNLFEEVNLIDTVQQLKKDDVYWYADEDVEHLVKKNNNKSFWYNVIKILSSNEFKLLVWCSIVIVVIVLAYYFAKANGIFLFTAKGKKISTATEQDVYTEDIFSIDYASAINKAEANSNYKLAIRFLFLQLLVKLHQAQIIHYTKEQTNADYLQYLTHKPQFVQFKTAANLYENVWYGNKLITADAYANFKKVFN
jgi:hypothetical protein